VVGREELEGITNGSRMRRPANQRWAQTQGVGANSRDLDADLVKIVLHAGGHCLVLAVETQVGAVASDVLDEARVSLDVAKLNLEEAARVLHQLEQFSVLDLLPNGAEVNQLHHVDVLIESAAVGVDSVVESAVETGDATVAAEGHDVSTAAVVRIQVPVLVGPHLAAGANTDFALVNNERNSVGGSQLSELLVVQGRSLFVSEARDRLNNNSADILASGLLLNNDLGSSVEASFLLGLVLRSVVREGVLQLGERSLGPFVGGRIGLVEVGIGARHGSDRVSVRSA